MTNGHAIGKTKILTSEDNSRILGVGISGSNAGELISEAMLAIEMGANVEDISLTIHLILHSVKRLQMHQKF